MLIVDDERDTVLALCIMLGREGYEVQGVHTAHDALLAVREFRPHVAIIDIVMQGMTGWELAADIRRIAGASGCPILVALSGNYGRRENRRWFMPAFDHYMTKPCDPEELLDFLAALEPKRSGWITR